MPPFISLLLRSFTDFIFPPNVEEIKIRSLPTDWLRNNAPKANPAEFPFIFSLFSYRNPLVREIIWQIKYKKNKHAIKCAGYALYSWLYERNFNCILIPIPISKKRRKERGYNQSELLIDEIIRFDKGGRLEKDYNILIRAKHIEKQTLKNRNERIENTKNIFEVILETNKNRKIVIIDDVTTTGSTLKEARDTLLEAGFDDVSALTIAH